VTGRSHALFMFGNDEVKRKGRVLQPSNTAPDRGGRGPGAPAQVRYPLVAGPVEACAALPNPSRPGQRTLRLCKALSSLNHELDRAGGSLAGGKHTHLDGG
jgi:hypothetical protein